MNKNLLLPNVNLAKQMSAAKCIGDELAKDSNNGGNKNNSETDLHDLIKTFQSEVKQSDWLKNNTADQWESQNPEVAKQYRDAIAEPKKTTDKADDKST